MPLKGIHSTGVDGPMSAPFSAAMKSAAGVTGAQADPCAACIDTGVPSPGPRPRPIEYDMSQQRFHFPSPIGQTVNTTIPLHLLHGFLLLRNTRRFGPNLAGGCVIQVVGTAHHLDKMTAKPHVLDIARHAMK